MSTVNCYAELFSDPDDELIQVAVLCSVCDKPTRASDIANDDGECFQCVDDARHFSSLAVAIEQPHEETDMFCLSLFVHDDYVDM